MAIRYKIIERPNPNKRKETKYYASACTTGDITFDDLCEEASHTSTVSGADFYASLYVLEEMMVHHLAHGKRVRVKGLGSFSVAIRSEGKNNAEEVHSQNMKDARILFRPSEKLSRMVKTLTYKKVS